MSPPGYGNDFSRASHRPIQEAPCVLARMEQLRHATSTSRLAESLDDAVSDQAVDIS